MPSPNAQRSNWRNSYIVMWTIENEHQLRWMRSTWGDSLATRWHVGYTQAMPGTHMNTMRSQLGSLFDAGYVRPPLVKWWDVDSAPLPLDIPAAL